MIVTCPNCDTRYNLPDAKIPAGGAKVKCSKCSQVFKTELPPETPEEEVEALLDEENRGGDTQPGEDFDDTFDDVAAGADAPAEDVADEPADEPDDEPADEPDDGPADEPDDEVADDVFDDDMGDAFDDLPDTDDLFDESEEELPAPDEGATPSAVEEERTAEDDLFADIGEDDADGEDDLFADDEEDGMDDEEDEGDSLFGDDDDLSLDEESEKGSRKSLVFLIILIVIALLLGAAIYFKAWTLVGINLGDMLKNVPFVGQMFMEETGGDTPAAPGESPAERVRKIELKNVKQYYVSNEKAGNLFVVEGKAVNKFDKPKEQIKVEVILYDGTNNVLTSQAFLCGNVLSQFQLQVQSEKEIKEGLSSEVGILSNNTFIRSGASTPFMAVFFKPPTGVKEFMVKVVDVGDPE